VSALTKIFVVLHVVVSLLLAASLIVFVNRQENFKIANAALSKDTIAAKNLADLRMAEVQKIRDQGAVVAVDKDSQIKVLQDAVAAGEKAVLDKDSQIAALNSDKVQLNTAVTSANAAVQVAQADMKARQEAYNGLKDSDDKVQKQLVEASSRITELTNGLEVTTKTARYMAEQVAQLQQQNAALNDILRKYNISPTGNTLPAGGAINGAANVNINGVVRDFRNINGVPFATISLGSADAVTRGMKFNVIDPAKGRFLGYLIIDTVNAHDATGRLEGPLVTQVQANVSEVRTQLY
jgi:hypothetical protein